MLDGWVRQRIDPALNALASGLARAGVTPNTVTITSWAIGMLAAAAIAASWPKTGLILLLLSRVGDGLDGAVASITGKTDFGGYLDIVLDFFFYGVIPLAFVIADPAVNGVAGAILILSFYVNGASFLAYAILAEKRGIQSKVRGEKSLYFTTGLAEATETIIVFAVMCAVPEWFTVLAFGFAVICFYTALSRIILALRIFRD